VRFKKPADFLSSVYVIEPSANESSTRRDRKNAKQSSQLIYLNICDHTYTNTLASSLVIASSAIHMTSSHSAEAIG